MIDKAQRTKAHNDLLANALDAMPATLVRDNIMAALEAQWWLRKFGVRLYYALLERVQEEQRELLDSHTKPEGTE